MLLRTLLTTALSTALLVSVGPPVSAAPTGATVTVEGDALAVTAPTGEADLGSWAETVGGGSFSGPLGLVQVVDARGAEGGTGWVASAVSSAFTTSGNVASIPAGDVSYAAGTIDFTGSMTLEAHDPDDLSQVVPVVSASEITGDNSATWTPTITVAIPDGTPAGVYAGTITHSVS